MDRNAKTIVIINPFSSAAYLSEEFKKYGLPTIALFTTPKDELHAYIAPEENLFNKQIYLGSPTPAAILKELSAYKIAYIVNGNESSTHLTDLVNSEILPFYANDPNSSFLRSNKFCMQEALKKCGLPYIQQKKILIDKIDRSFLNGVKFPCYCKPVHGMATIGAFKASSPNELLKNLNETKGHALLLDASEYLIQEFIEGDEFIIDTFSYHGNHLVSSVQKYKKQFINDVPVYRTIEIVHDKQIWNRCKDFVEKCLDIAHFKNGFAHSEIFLTSDNETKLIEINPRISGGKGYHNKLAKLEQLKSQIDLLVECVFDGPPQESVLVENLGIARILCLFNFSNRPLKDPSEHLFKFRSVKFYDLINPIGFLSKNERKTLADLDLLVMLYNQNREVLEQDTEDIFLLEKNGELF